MIGLRRRGILRAQAKTLFFLAKDARRGEQQLHRALPFVAGLSAVRCWEYSVS